MVSALFQMLKWTSFNFRVEMSKISNNVRIIAIIRPLKKKEWKIQIWHLTSDILLPELDHDLQTNACDYDARNNHRMCTSCWQDHIRGDSPSIQECRFHHFRLLHHSEGQLQEAFSKAIPAERLPAFNSQ